MHELGIVQDLVELAEEELAHRGGGGPVVSLTVRVGLLSGVNPEAMEFAFEIVAPSSRLGKARLKIITDRPILTCCICGHKVELDDLALECPACGRDEVEISGGRDLILESITLENQS